MTKPSAIYPDHTCRRDSDRCIRVWCWAPYDVALSMMWRPIYTRYRLVGGRLEMCRWRWVTSRLSRVGRVRFPEWPTVDWEALADYESGQRSPDAPDAALPRPPDAAVATVRRQILLNAFRAGLSYQDASQRAVVTPRAAYRAYQGFRREGDKKCDS